MDRVTKEMFEVILKKLDKIEGRFDSLETEVKEFRSEMKDQIRGLDDKMDLIYHKLKSDISNLNHTTSSKYNVAKED